MCSIYGCTYVVWYGIATRPSVRPSIHQMQFAAAIYWRCGGCFISLVNIGDAAGLVWFRIESGSSSRATYLNKDEALFYRSRFHFGRKCHVGRMIRIAMQGWGQQNLLLFFHAHCMHCWLYVVDGWGFAGGATATKAPRNSQQVMYRRTFDINVLWIVSVLMSPASPILRHLTTTTNRLDWITFFYSAERNGQ